MNYDVFLINIKGFLVIHFPLLSLTFFPHLILGIGSEKLSNGGPSILLTSKLTPGKSEEKEDLAS